MKAMVLCAGKGTRLRPLTWTTPKPMIPLVDKPVLEYIVEHLKKHGVDEIAINLSYLPDEIHKHFRDGRNHGVDIFYSYEGEMKDGEFTGIAVGSAGGMKKIQEESGFFDDTFLVLCGDAAVNLDISKLVAEHKKRGALASIILKQVAQEEVVSYGIVELDKEGRIKKFQEKPTPEEAVSTTANTGIYIFEPEIFNHIPSGVEFDLGGDLFPELAKISDKFYGAVADFDWIDIGNLKDFRSATSELLVDTPRDMHLPGREVSPGVRVGPNVTVDFDSCQIEGPVYIGAGSVIENNVTVVGPAVIGQNCRIGEFSILHQSVLGDHIRVRRNTLLTRAIAYGGYLINERGDSERLAPGGAVGDAREPEVGASAQEHAVANLSLVDQMINSEMTLRLKERKRA